MKSFFAAILATSTLFISAHAADVTTKLSNVHLCCSSCVTIAEKTVAKVPNAKAVVDQDDDSITLTGPDTATVQKAANALVAAGYFGKSSDPSIKITSDTGAKGVKVQTLNVSDVHLCCAKCVKAVNEAAKTVPGVTGTTAAKNAKTFQVTGDFNDKDLFAAFQKAGLTGKESN